MADCELLPNCIFFNDRMDKMPTASEFMKRRYCRNSNQHCARWTVYCALGKGNVPPDLTPNALERAQEIIDRAQEEK